MIKFHEIYKSDKEKEYILDALSTGNISGDGKYTDLVEREIARIFSNEKVLMTTSCTHSLELALDLVKRDGRQEVIVPSFGFPSVATAVLKAGFIPVFAKVDFDDMNIDPEDVESIITDNTRGIIAIHYGGFAFDVDGIRKIKNKYDLFLIEDCAQAFLSKHGDDLLGTIGDFSCFSFHGTKNITCGEGGCLLINSNDQSIYERAHNIRQKGTNRRQFQRGESSKYYWVDKGSSYCPSDMLMAYLYGQLSEKEYIQRGRMFIFQSYYEFFQDYKGDLLISFSGMKNRDGGNGHLFYIFFKDIMDASRFIEHMNASQIEVYKHFYPLAHSPMGGNFTGDSDFSKEKDLFDRLVRLPLHANMSVEDLETVLSALDDFF